METRGVSAPAIFSCDYDQSIIERDEETITREERIACATEGSFT
jgi:hypothetical protein